MEKKKNKGTGKSKTEKISDSTIRRLSSYHRTLKRMEKQNIKRTTSMELAESENIDPAKIRKDLSYFGTFGCRGVGYDVQTLKTELANILGFSRPWGLVIIGGGLLSETLINSQALKDNNFTINKIFEKNPDMLKNSNGLAGVFSISQLEKKIDPEEDHLAIIALPHPEIQPIIDRLGKIGIKGVLYMASRSVNAPDNMIVMNQDISLKLGMMTYKVLEKDG
ncbi:MAG: hypothetical protein C0407_00105 [Desulfobacca sp.]|nr:hypothetical protein [Desulfobacca sp.]